MCVSHAGAWLWLCTHTHPLCLAALLAEPQRQPRPPLCLGISASTQQPRGIVPFLFEQVPCQEAQHLLGLLLGLHVCLLGNVLSVLQGFTCTSGVYMYACWATSSVYFSSRTYCCSLASCHLSPRDMRVCSLTSALPAPPLEAASWLTLLRLVSDPPSVRPSACCLVVRVRLSMRRPEAAVLLRLWSDNRARLSLLSR